MTTRTSPWLPVHVEAIPEALRALPWVLWRAEPRLNGAVAKVPYQIADPLRRASSTNPKTWGLWREVGEAYGRLAGDPPDPERGPIAGIGVVLTREACLTCVDLDAVIDAEGALDPRAARIVHQLDSWTERSPSGTGLHIFAGGALPEPLIGPQVEMYSSARFICVTGHRWPGTPAGLRDGQRWLDDLRARVHRADPPPRPYAGPIVPAPDDLAGALLGKLAAWRLAHGPVRRWQDGYLVELEDCPWTDAHTTGPGGAVVIIHGSGALDFTCLHAHCRGRTWRDFRQAMELT
jgi:hypothetical protein